MDIAIKITQGECNDCHRVFAILSKSYKGKATTQKIHITCPECNSSKIHLYTGVKSYLMTTKKDLEKLSNILKHDEQCVKCGKPIDFLSRKKPITIQLLKYEDDIIDEVSNVDEILLFCTECYSKLSSKALLKFAEEYYRKKEGQEFDEIKIIKG